MKRINPVSAAAVETKSSLQQRQPFWTHSKLRKQFRYQKWGQQKITRQFSTPLLPSSRWKGHITSWKIRRRVDRIYNWICFLLLTLKFQVTESRKPQAYCVLEVFKMEKFQIPGKRKWQKRRNTFPYLPCNVSRDFGLFCHNRFSVIDLSSRCHKEEWHENDDSKNAEWILKLWQNKRVRLFLNPRNSSTTEMGKV